MRVRERRGRCRRVRESRGGGEEGEIKNKRKELKKERERKKVRACEKIRDEKKLETPVCCKRLRARFPLAPDSRDCNPM